MTKMNGAKAVVESLKKQKVKDVFGIPGGATLYIYDVLYDSGLNHVLARHEQGAGLGRGDSWHERCFGPC